MSGAIRPLKGETVMRVPQQAAPVTRTLSRLAQEATRGHVMPSFFADVFDTFGLGSFAR